MREWYRQQEGQKLEGWAFTFCKAAFLVLIFQAVCAARSLRAGGALLRTGRTARGEAVAVLGETAMGNDLLGRNIRLAGLGDCAPLNDAGEPRRNRLSLAVRVPENQG